jgi:hypothetical protein
VDLNVIKQEMENWIVNYLDKPNKHFNNIPVCPFAKKAWFDNKVKVLLGSEKEALHELKHWDDNYDLVVIVYSEWDKIREWESAVNAKVYEEDLYVMVFDSSDTTAEDPEDQGDWGVLTDDVYSWVFIQRLSEVEKYSNILEKGGYYKNSSPEFMQYINKRRMYNGWKKQSNDET